MLEENFLLLVKDSYSSVVSFADLASTQSINQMKMLRSLGDWYITKFNKVLLLPVCISKKKLFN